MRRRLKGFGDIVGLFFQSTPLRGKQWLVVRYTARQDCLDAIGEHAVPRRPPPRRALVREGLADLLPPTASVNKDDLGFATRWPDDYEHMQVLARAVRLSSSLSLALSRRPPSSCRLTSSLSPRSQPSSWFNKGDVDDMLVLVEDNFGQRPIGVALSPNKTKLVLQMQSANSADEIINSRRTSLPDGTSPLPPSLSAPD